MDRDKPVRPVNEDEVRPVASISGICNNCEAELTADLGVPAHCAVSTSKVTLLPPTVLGPEHILGLRYLLQ